MLVLTVWQQFATALRLPKHVGACLGSHFRLRLLHPQIRAQSFASRSPLASTQAEIDATFVKEWDRRLLTTLGVANKRLYELRLQAPQATFEGKEVRRLGTSFFAWRKRSACKTCLKVRSHS